FLRLFGEVSSFYPVARPDPEGGCIVGKGGCNKALVQGLGASESATAGAGGVQGAEVSDGGQGDFLICFEEEGRECWLRVHRCILAARSGFFASLLKGGMSEAMDGRLTLQLQPPIGLKPLLALLRFIYTESTGTLDPLSALDILAITRGETNSGGYFQLVGNESLRAECTAALLKGMNSENALALLSEEIGI
ncbi:unnamed protein product, partial [Discosporangium mesarthrocarpum]